MLRTKIKGGLLFHNFIDLEDQLWMPDEKDIEAVLSDDEKQDNKVKKNGFKFKVLLINEYV